ncbi:MAG: RidA family protein [Alphaproteobacteria bacterium]|nr:RidA family protein [Alphaproteobacteria bacterium]
MAGRIEARLKKLGIVLPNPPNPAGNYVPAVRAGHILFVSAQGPIVDGKPAYQGKIGRDISVEDGNAAGRIAGLNTLARVKQALDGDLDRVKGVFKVVGFMNILPGFTQMPRVLDGASDLFVQVFGDRAKHARAAIGIAALPQNLAIAVDATFAVE